VPLKAWIKSALDHVVQACLSEPDLEFVWVGDDAVDPLQQAQTLNILVGAGIKTIAEARAELGLAPEGKAAPRFGKYNPNHDERGRFATANDAVEPGAADAKAPKNVQFAVNDTARTKSDASGAAIVAEGPTEEEPKLDSEDESEGGTYFDPQTGRMITFPPGSAIGAGRASGWINLRDLPQGPTFLSAPESDEPPGTVAEAVAPNGVLPGASDRGPESPRTMPASDDPNRAALDFVAKAYNGETPVSVSTPESLSPGGFVALLPDGTYITFRPAGQASSRTSATTATVELNGPGINALNGNEQLKLKVPGK